LYKVELLLLLVRQGWEDGECHEPLAVGSPLVCKLSIKRALSYLAAMAYKTEIFAKGVPVIHHDRPDFYYRSLIRLPASDLAKMLLNYEGKDDAWFRKFVNDHDEESESSSDDSDPGRPPPRRRPVEPPGALLALPAPVPVLHPDFIPWTRKIVSVPDGVELKVYFGHNVSHGMLQEAWLTCIVHKNTGCIRWRRATGEPRDFFAYMYCWHEDARDNHDLGNKVAHMAHEPRPDRVEEVAKHLLLREF